MKRWKKILLGTLLTLVAALALFLVPTVWGKPWFIEHFYARVFLQFALDHPQMLTSMRVLEPIGLHFHNNDLDDLSPESTLRDLRRAQDALDMLKRYDRETLSDPLSYDVMEFFLTIAVDGTEFAFHDYPVNQFAGIQSGLPNFMINTHLIETERDARHYIERLGKFGTAFNQLLESLESREAMGVAPPRFVITHVLREMRDFVASPPEEHVLFSHLEDKLAEIEGLGERQKAALLRGAAVELKRAVYPAYQRLIEYFVELEPEATTDDGVWKLPDGERYYAYALRSFTTTDLPPEEVHQLGLQEVDRIQEEMKLILRVEGYPTDDLGATLQELNRDPRFLYPDSDQGRQQILADFQAIIDEIDSGMDPFFAMRPAARVEVRRVPEFTEATAPAAYYQPPSLDGSRPGVFFVNLRSVQEIPRFAMRTLAYHEAIPGHHFQIALAQEQRGLPFFRRVVPFPAYSEGWALYAEQVAAERGFQADPYDRLGYLRDQLFRAARLVVDTGIHHKRWTREEAIDYMLANTGIPEGEVVSEVERYIVFPGQACAYMIGRLEILRLRAEARAALGDDFDLRDFHRVALGNGALPLTLLRRVVEEWYRGASSP
jgi:uncharacterized protein (DUF885 family)